MLLVNCWSFFFYSMCFLHHVTQWNQCGSIIWRWALVHRVMWCPWVLQICVRSVNYIKAVLFMCLGPVMLFKTHWKLIHPVIQDIIENHFVLSFLCVILHYWWGQVLCILLFLSKKCVLLLWKCDYMRFPLYYLYKDWIWV